MGAMPRCRQAAAVRIEPDNTIATLSGMRTGRTTSAQAVGGRRLWAIPGREESHDRTAKRWLERAIDREEGDVAASALRRHPVPTNEAVEMPKYLYAANYTKLHQARTRRSAQQGREGPRGCHR